MMSRHSILSALGLIALIVISVQIFAEPTRAITATVDIDPNTLNLKRQGRWITAYITLPSNNVEEIDISTVALGNVPAEWGQVENDALMVKFDSQNVIVYVEILLSHMGITSGGKVTVELTVTGKLNDGTPFMASDTVAVLIPF